MMMMMMMMMMMTMMNDVPGAALLDRRLFRAAESTAGGYAPPQRAFAQTRRAARWVCADGRHCGDADTPFVRSFIHSSTHSSIHSFVRSCIHSLIHVQGVRKYYFIFIEHRGVWKFEKLLIPELFLIPNYYLYTRRKMIPENCLWTKNFSQQSFCWISRRRRRRGIFRRNLAGIHQKSRDFHVSRSFVMKK